MKIPKCSRNPIIIKIKDRKIKVVWGDITKFNIKNIKKRFDATIIATSKTHINNKNLMKKFLHIMIFFIKTY